MNVFSDIIHIPAKSPQKKKTENSTPHGYELHRPSSKGAELLFQGIQAIIDQYLVVDVFSDIIHKLDH